MVGKEIMAGMAGNKSLEHRVGFHPFFLSLFPVLMLYGTSVYKVSWQELLLPVLLVLGASSCLLLFCSRLLKDRVKSACLVSLFWILFFSFGRIQSLVQNWMIGSVNIGRDRYVFLVLAILFAITSFALYLSGEWAVRINSLLHRFSLMLVAVALTFCFVSAYVHAGGESLPSSVLSNRAALKPRFYSPDIYHIVLDAYGRSDVLRELYGYDNSEFLDQLKKERFYIADRSRSNYLHTASSMSSTLNLDYLPPLSPSHSAFFSNFRWKSVGHEGLKGNLVLDILRTLNYKTISFYSEYDIPSTPRADIYIGSHHKISAFHRALLNKTPMRILLHKLGKSNWQSPYRIDRHRRAILFALNYLPQIAGESRDYPVYAYAHLIVPHPPFVFGEGGEPSDLRRPFTFWDELGFKTLEGDLRSEYIEGYKMQAVFISRKIVETVTKILKASSQPPIIIIHGDHGPAAFVDWDHPEPMGLKERFSILNAYYFPGGGDRFLYDSISPVNTFRVLFNYYFGADYPLLPDANYLPLSRGKLVREEVTHRF